MGKLNGKVNSRILIGKIILGENFGVA